MSSAVSNCGSASRGLPARARARPSSTRGLLVARRELDRACQVREGQIETAADAEQTAQFQLCPGVGRVEPGEGLERADRLVRSAGVDERQRQVAVRGQVCRVFLCRSLEQPDGIVQGAGLHRQQAALESRAASGGQKDEALNERVVYRGRGFVRPFEMETGPVPVPQIPASQCQGMVNATGGGREFECPFESLGGGRCVPGVECDPAEAVVGGRLIRVEGKGLSPARLRFRRQAKPVFDFRETEQHSHLVRCGRQHGSVAPSGRLQVAAGVEREGLQIRPAPVVRIESLRFPVAGERVLEQVEGFGLEELQSVVEAAEFAERVGDLRRVCAFRV